MSYSIGVFGCQHLGYRMRGMRTHGPSGLNLREVDGYIAHRLVMQDMLAAGVSGIVDGGDTFHVADPSTESINVALRTDDLRIDGSGDDKLIWRITNGGNHDNGGGRSRSAVATLHRPHLAAFSIFPDPTREDVDKVTPWPGYYEIHQPDPEVPLYLHLIPHNGLDDKLADRGIDISPEPIEGGINLLFAHGMFSADGRLFAASDRHGPERIIPAEWAIDRGWDAAPLSDYHTLGPIPGYGPEDGYERGQIWETGSLLRRGYSDDECGRGWLKITIGDDGAVSVEPQLVWQRPQIDFPILDASTMSAEEIDAEVRRRIMAQPLVDSESKQLTGDGGIILRQRISGASASQKPALRAAAIEWARLAEDAAYFDAPFYNTVTSSDTTAIAVDHKGTAERVTDFVGAFDKRSEGTGRLAAALDALPSGVRETVVTKTKARLADIKIAAE